MAANWFADQEPGPVTKKGKESTPPAPPKKAGGGSGGSAKGPEQGQKQGQRQAIAPTALGAYNEAVTGSRSDTPAVKGLSEGIAVSISCDYLLCVLLL